MAKVHSRRTRAHVGKVPIACHVREVGVDHEVSMIDTTTLCDNAYTFVDGVESGSFSFGGLVDSDAALVFTPLEDLRQLGADTAVSVAPAGYGLGEQVWLAQAKLSELGHDTRPSDAAMFSLEMTVEGRPDLGVALHDVTAAETVGGNGTSSDNGAATTAGGAAVVHCSAFTGTSVTVKVQHSADNSSWADLVTFTAITAAGAQHSTVAGTVNRYLRATWSGTFSSATFAVAFARR
jgi:hypothetical protein